MAGLGWIDFSNEHRDRVFSVVDLLKADSTVDELGIGTVRDAIADWLFPGVSTIQTRPKYFILIPQLLRSYLQESTKKQKLKKLVHYLSDEEDNLMNALANKYRGKKGKGVIGINVSRKNGELKRKPSSIYWNGLKVHGIIESPFSLSEYLQKNDLSEIESEGHQEELDDSSILWVDNFGIKIPKLPEINLEEVKMDLTEKEAKYLKDQFLTTDGTTKHEGNLLSQILKSEDRINIILKAENFQVLASELLKDKSLNGETKKILRIALDFDFLMHGAHIRYNIQLHQRAGVKDFRGNWEYWLKELNDKRNELNEFDFDYIFKNIATRTKARSQIFMKTWKDEVLKESIGIEKLDQLVRNQEIRIKGSRAKLTSSSGEYTKWIGIEGLQYRFNQAKNIIKDINTANA